MDAIDILGSLLGHKTSRAGRGTDVLSDILKRKTSGNAKSPSSPSSSATPRPLDIEREAKELEDLLNVANDRVARRGGQPPSSAPRSQTQRPEASFQEDAAHRGARSDRGQYDAALSEDDKAKILVRAMVNAAKSDGRIDSSEQKNIYARLGDTDRESIEFLREEFVRPLDVREFVWSVPIGMEQQVYTLSLIAMDLDTRREEEYLRELAHGLRLTPAVRNQIHRRLGLQ